MRKNDEKICIQQGVSVIIPPSDHLHSMTQISNADQSKCDKTTNIIVFNTCLWVQKSSELQCFLQLGRIHIGTIPSFFYQLLHSQRWYSSHITCNFISTMQLYCIDNVIGIGNYLSKFLKRHKISLFRFVCKSSS